MSSNGGISSKIVSAPPVVSAVARRRIVTLAEDKTLGERFLFAARSFH
ncbi:MAG: hypothetical protein ACRDL0_20060 [Thermoleophilaceae bacterium]